jgi:geranylgeranyl diphosphate synthase type II
MDITTYVDNIQKTVDTTLDGYLQPKADIPKILIEAMRYSVFAADKRFRSILSIASCQTIGGKIEEILPVACAVELINTSFFIFDDLPSIENNDYRKGKLSNHKVFGEDIAIAAGNCLLAYAFELVINDYDKENFKSKIALRLLQEISKATGITGMVSGQVVEMTSRDKEMDKYVLQYIHNHRTSALIVASVKAGAIVAEATVNELETLIDYAKNIAFAVQMIEDYLDADGDKNKLSKAAEGDIQMRKKTYYSVYGREKASKMAHEKIFLAKSYLNSLKTPDLLFQLADFIITYRIE